LSCYTAEWPDGHFLYSRHALMRSRILLVFLVLLLAGCGANATGNAGSSPKTTLHVWYSTDDPVERAWTPRLVTLFEASHPNIAVQLTAYDFEDINTKLQLALSAGDPPDLAYVTPRGPGIPAYVKAGTLRNLASAARNDGWAKELRPGLLAQYNQPFTFFGATKGQIMAVPMAMAAVGVLYNTKLLHQLHRPVPGTLAEFKADLPPAKRAGMVPLGMGNGDGWLGDDWYQTLVEALIPPSTLTAEQLLKPFDFGRPPFSQAGSLMRAWSKAGYFTQNFGGLDAQEGIDQFFKGHTLFQLVSSSENSQIAVEERQTHLPIGIFGFPTAYGGSVSPMSGYEGWIVPKKSSHPAAAIAFINQVLQPSTAQALLDRGFIPAHRGSFRTGVAWQQQYLDMVTNAHRGVYLDAAPIANLNATMEANVQLLLQGYEGPGFLVHALQEVYSSRGKQHGSTARIDGEF